MKKQTLIALLLGAAFIGAAHAETYEYIPDPKDPKSVQTFKVSLAGGKVSAESCLGQGRCNQGNVSVDTLSKQLKDSIAGYDKLLSDKTKLMADAKKQAAAKDAQVVNDEASKKKFVMIKAGDMTLALDMEQVGKGDFSLVPAAMESTRERYKSTLDILSSGKIPAGFKTDEYSKIAPIYQLVNIVVHSK